MQAGEHEWLLSVLFASTQEIEDVGAVSGVHMALYACVFSVGMVYNVSAYMDFHPGGEEELMRAAGIDSTDLFDQVHSPWAECLTVYVTCTVTYKYTLHCLHPPLMLLTWK